MNKQRKAPRAKPYKMEVGEIYVEPKLKSKKELKELSKEE